MVAFMPQMPAFQPWEASTAIRPNRVTPYARFLPRQTVYPKVHPTATIRGNTQIIGDVTVSPRVHIANAVLRADEGTPFFIGEGSNLQDFVLLHAHSTQADGRPKWENLIPVPGKGYYAVYIGKNTSLAHGAIVHGPVYIGDNSFISFKATIDHASIGNNVEIGAHAYIKNVAIPDNVAIAPGAVITRPEDIRRFIAPRQNLNPKIARINSEMALAYHVGNPQR